MNTDKPITFDEWYFENSDRLDIDFKKWHEEHAKYLEPSDIIPWCREAWKAGAQSQFKQSTRPIVEPPVPLVPLGQKFDDHKPRWDLIPYEALQEVVAVLTHGSQKYGPENWRKVPEGERRYFAAAQRHLVSHRLGERLDPESGLPHLAHAACCLLFMLAKEVGHDLG